LEALFERIPELGLAYNFRGGITDIFDTARTREEAASRLEEFRGLLDPEDPDNQELLRFFETYDAHKDGILAYFDARKTSGPIEGLNNKARVITKRCYGVKSAATLWTRLCLDVNLAGMAVSFTVPQIHDLTNTIRSLFLGFYT
jgi:transposase